MVSSAKNHPQLEALKIAVTVILISSLSFLPTRSVCLQLSSYNKRLKQREMLLGSRPPGCVNKCRNCRPCTPTLVIPPHHDKLGSFKDSSHDHDHDHAEDDYYYLLSWKCTCGNKFYQP